MLGLLFNFSVSADNTTIPEYLQLISVKISTDTHTGSGVVFTRKDSTGTKNISFVWSVGHLFENEIDTSIINSTNSTNIFPKPTRIIVKTASATQDIVTDGEIVGTNLSTIKLMKYSDWEKEDIALTLLETNVFNTNTVKFDLINKIPRLGDRIYNLSYPYGEMTFSEGNISSIGVKMDGFYYDQTSCVIYPGSSGGGYFTTNGLCIGLVDTTTAPSMNYMVTIRTMRKWAKENHVEWALDPSIPIPSRSELEKLVVH